MKKYMNDITKMDITELSKKASELKTEITDLRRGIKTGDVQNTQAVRARKKELARVLTMLSIKPAIEIKSEVKKVKKAVKPATKEKK